MATTMPLRLLMRLQLAQASSHHHRQPLLVAPLSSLSDRLNLARAPSPAGLFFCCSPRSAAPGGEQPAEQICRRQAPSSSADDEARRVGRGNAGERVAQAAGDGHRRIGERGRGGEPIGGGDVEADRGGHGVRLEADAAEDGGDQPEGGDELSGPLRRPRCAPSTRAGSGRARTSDAPAPRRRSRRRSARRHRRAAVRSIELAADQHHQAHRRIEMRAGNWREDGDDDEQHGAGRRSCCRAARSPDYRRRASPP